MEKRYISESRYKRSSTTRKRRSIETVKNNVRNSNTPAKTSSDSKKKVKNVPVDKVNKKIKKQRGKVYNIVVCALLLMAVGALSRTILKDESEPFIPSFVWEEENTDTLKLGIITTDKMSYLNTNNLLIGEMKKYSMNMILNVNTNYTITYGVLKSVQKISNTEYTLNVSDDVELTADDVKNTIENYMKDTASYYNKKFANIASVEKSSNKSLSIKLKANDPYFIYNLELPLEKTSDDYIQDTALATADKLSYTRNKNAKKSLVKQIDINKYKDMYKEVEAFKDGNVDLFITSLKNVETMLGKYEYNIKSYRNGSALFLFGNKKSKLFSRKEIRTAVAYSIDRDSIINSAIEGAGEKIDLPYIYDIVKYKYDIYATENLMLTNGYKKQGKIYTKTENGKRTKVELTILVNKEDDEKVKVSSIIKNNLEAVGIGVNVEALNVSKLQDRIKSGEYDMLLASVDLNSNPDIEFVSGYINISMSVDEAIRAVENSNMQQLNSNIQKLQTTLSNEVACIGIYAKQSFVISKKSILNLNDIKYMNILTNIMQ